ncbi:MAG: tetratricopeptide repeat protein [Hyphomonadaceae bacterium]|nr:tetratricopeptide repeat protein [Hyphomonadaceae bacterium]
MKHVWAAALVLGAAACASAPPRPDTSQVYADYLVAHLAQLRRDHRAAADRYFAALSRSPNDAAVLDGALSAALAGGEAERALAAARRARSADAPASARILRGADALASGRWNAAASELDAVEGAAAAELTARMLFVWARAGQGRLDSVLVDLAPFASIRPYGSLLAYQQAMVLDYAGRREEALAAYALAATNGMFLPQAIERRADLLARSGRSDDALRVLAAYADRQNPGLAAAHARLSAGEAASNVALTPARGAAISLYGLAAIYFEEFDAQSGLAALTIAQMLDSEDDASRLAFAQQHNRLGNTDLAQAALAQVRDTSPYAAFARTTGAWIVFESGDQEAALALAHANAESGDFRARRSLADMYRNVGRYGDAEAVYSGLIEQQPQDWRLHFSRGAARERQGRHADAEADFVRALELSPDQPDVMNYLGYMWVDRGERLAEAMALIERAVALRPSSAAIIDSLGWAHYRLGNYERAQELIERAVTLEPADPTLNDHLGDVYWRLGRRTEARFQWRRTLTLNPDNPAQIQEKLERGLPPAAPRP